MDFEQILKYLGVLCKHYNIHLKIIEAVGGIPMAEAGLKDSRLLSATLQGA